jgi:transposase
MMLGGFMPGKKYRVKLTNEEREHLEGLISRGTVAARKATHARILLHADESSDAGYFKDEDIAEVLHIGRVTVERVRKRFVEEGLESALIPKPRTRHRPKKLDGEAEAFLVATACSKAPEGRTDWTLQLLADRLVECQVVDSISAEAVRQVLKKTRSNPG